AQPPMPSLALRHDKGIDLEQHLRPREAADNQAGRYRMNPSQMPPDGPVDRDAMGAVVDIDIDLADVVDRAARLGEQGLQLSHRAAGCGRRPRGGAADPVPRAALEIRAGLAAKEDLLIGADDHAAVPVDIVLEPVLDAEPAQPLVLLLALPRDAVG